jgi:hypothetical protein
MVARALKRWGPKLLAGARAAHENEDGGTMVFGAMTLFTLVVFTMLVYQVGMTSGDKIQLQGAADAAAYSGALVEAESLESIAFLNDGMAFVYYAECRYTVDAIVYGTLHAFERQTEWVQQNNPNALTQYQEGPWDITEQTFQPGPPVNNPGAYSQSRSPRLPLQGQPNYKAGVEPGGTAPNQTATKDYNWVILGAPQGQDIFVSRLEATKKHVQNLVPKGKQWLADIHWAERIILAATPQLVANTCVKVAFDNGAEAVAVSDDLSRVFALDSAKNYQDAGFTVTSPGIDKEMAQRYQTKSNPVDQKARALPTWFEADTGTAINAYTQIRICWNKRDWDHQSQMPPNGYSSHDQYPPNFSSSPAGHWHMIHTHNLDDVDPTGQYPPVGPFLRYADGGEPDGDGQSFHDYGHGVSSGDDAGQHSVTGHPELVDSTKGDFTTYNNPQFSTVDTGAANQTHHAAQLCPTCSAYDPTSAGWGQVVHSGPDAGSNGQSDADWALSLSDESGSPSFQAGTATALKFDQSKNEVTPRPIRLKGRVFRSGVSVATWKPGRGLGSIFAPSPFGLLSIASAQVGVRGGDGKLQVATDASDTSVTLQNGTQITLSDNNGGATANFYLDDYQAQKPPQGLRFGARLVPIARSLTWADTQGSTAKPEATGLNNLLYGNRWYTSPTGSPGAGPANVAQLKSVIPDVGASASSFPQ